ncbi:small nuclear ribonucleoprotein E-like [Odocoileus virginianus]|uniref:Small nuclear ribonucleoprotein E n=1 Tax=Odocoileus virginianus TaxID=9874 RepID=A0ABM4IHG3_ODOVR
MTTFFQTSSTAYWGQGQKVQKVMVQPISLIFRYLQNRSWIQVWLYEQVNMQIEGCIIGFDEYMNLVLDDAAKIHSKTKSRKQLGWIMLKGDNITLLQSVSN